MYYLLTRYYDPQTGRFINADSIEYLEPKTINGLNLYSYCNSNPVMNVDPYGHSWWSNFWNGVWNFIVDWYEQVMAVNAQTSATNTGVLQSQNKQVAEGILAVAKHNMTAQGQIADSEKEMGKQSADLLYNAGGELMKGAFKAMEWGVKTVIPEPSADDVANITSAMSGAAGSPHLYIIDDLFSDVVTVSWE